jgi:nitrogen-specific signal transduction histidine kinase
MDAVRNTSPGRVPMVRPAAGRPERQTLLAARMDSASQLAGGVAHDLNNILTAILGFGTLVAEQVSTDPDALANAREVLAAGERAARLTQRLLAFAGRQVLTPLTCDVAELLTEMLPAIRDAAGPHVDVSTQVQAGAKLSIDMARLQEALIELAGNARYAMPDGGRLLIEVDVVTIDDTPVSEPVVAGQVSAAAGPYVRIAVTDTGAGMSHDVQARIFEPFFTTKPRGQGGGLGLSMIHGFIRQSGGDIWVYSEPGIGTTFKIYLPAVGHVSGVRPARTSTVTPGAGQTVLVVDDVDAIRTLTADLLRRAGYRVLVAGSAAAALSMAANARGPIHLLLTDVVMPGSGGVELARELRTERRGLRVLYMSGYSDNAVVARGLLGPGDAFLQKPFTRDRLLQQVAALVQ